MFDFFSYTFSCFFVVVVFSFSKKRTKAFVQRIGRQALHNSPQDQNYTRTFGKVSRLYRTKFDELLFL